MEHLTGGIWVRVGKAGRKTFVWRRRVPGIVENGVRKYRDVRRALGHSLERAQALAKALDAEADAQERGEAPRHEATLGEYIARYVAHIRDVRKLLGWATAAGNVATFEKFIGGHVALRSITRADIERFQDKRRQTVRPVTANSSLRDVKRMLTVAADEGFVDSNPAAKVKPLAARRMPVQLPTPEELGRYVGHLKAKGSWLYPLVLALAGLGCRLGEALRMDWRDVDLGRGQMVLRRRKTSDALPMTLAGPLKGALWDLWTAQGMPTTGLVFTRGDGLEVNRFTARERMKSAARKVGLPWLTPRTFRRLAATTVWEATGDARAAQHLLGHSTVTTTENYLGRGDEARTRGLEAMADHISRALGTNSGTSAQPEATAKQDQGSKSR